MRQHCEKCGTKLQRRISLHYLPASRYRILRPYATARSACATPETGRSQLGAQCKVSGVRQLATPSGIDLNTSTHLNRGNKAHPERD